MNNTTQADNPPQNTSTIGETINTVSPYKNAFEGSRPLLTCIPCNDSKAQKPTSSLGAALPKGSDDGIRSDCQNRIIDLEELKKLINPNLLPCSKCKQGQLKLVEKSRISYSSVFQLRCDVCHGEKEKLQKKIIYKEKKIAGLEIKAF